MVDTAYTAHVTPSGDGSGETDTRNIQRAVDTLQSSTDVLCMSTLRLAPGRYRINRQINLGTTDNPSRVVVSGVDAAIGRVGEQKPDEYMLKVVGLDRQDPIDILSGVKLFCLNLSRGVRLESTHFGRLANVVVQGSIGVGIDMDKSWNVDLDHVTVPYARGFAIRAKGNSVAHWDSVSVLFWSSTNWPTGVTAGEMAAVAINSSGTLITNFHTEDCGETEYPVLRLTGSGIKVDTWRCESLRQKRHYVQLDNAGMCHITNVHLSDDVPSECFARATGVTYNNTIERLNGHAKVGRVLIHDSGTHKGNRVENVCLHTAGIGRSDWVGAVNGATVDNEWWDGSKDKDFVDPT